MEKFSLSRMVCIVVVCCAATAIASTCTNPNHVGKFRRQQRVGSFCTDSGYGTGTSTEQPSGAGAYYVYGTVFKMTPSGTLTTLYSFCPQPQPYCVDGAFPSAGLVQATDGNFYGTTAQGGTSSNAGTVFKITPSGTLTTLYSFCPQYPCTMVPCPTAG